MKYTITCEGKEFEVEVIAKSNKVLVKTKNGDYEIILDKNTNSITNAYLKNLSNNLEEKRIEFGWQRNQEGYNLLIDGISYEIKFKDIFSEKLKEFLPKQTALTKGAVEVKAPIPGRITEVLVKVGDTIKKDRPLVILDAMKLENEISAPIDGKVKAINIKEGEAVDKGQLLVIIG